MSEITAVLDQMKSIEDNQKALQARLDEVSKTAEQHRANGPWGASVRTGESIMGSRGYSFTKALGLIAGQLDRDQCKIECDITDKLKNYYNGFGFKKALTNSVFLPFWGAGLTGDERLADEVSQVVRAGYHGFDRDELSYLRQRMASLGYTKALSWTDEAAGGALVAPPAFGELIEVLRNNEVLMAAGARTLPMPPQGRITFPRQTSAMTAYHVGESVQLTDSTPGTGDVTMQAKKLTILAKIPNELFHFAAIPIEGFIREDMTRVIALKMDKTLLEDVGSTTTPKGLINYSVNSYTSAGTPSDSNNGYPFDPIDPYKMVATVEEKNATFRAFIMRPMLWATLVTRRAKVYNGSASVDTGQFMFNVFREVSQDMSIDRLKVGSLCGYPVYKSTQVSITRVRGTGTDLTYVLGGDFADYLIAMGGALEFQVSTQGDTPFTYDQTWFKGVLYYDGAPRHEASFVLCDQIEQST